MGTEFEAKRPGVPQTAVPIFYRRIMGTVPLYGQVIPVIGFAGFEYEDGKRNYNVGDAYLADVSERTGIPVADIQRQNRIDTLVWAVASHARGYMLSGVNEHGMINNTDAHHENFILSVSARTRQVSDLQATMFEPDASLHWRQQEILDTLFGIQRRGEGPIPDDLVRDALAQLVRYEPSVAVRAALAQRIIEETGHTYDHSALLDLLRHVEAGTLAVQPILTPIEAEIVQLVHTQPAEAIEGIPGIPPVPQDRTFAAASIYYWYLRMKGTAHETAASAALKTLWMERAALGVMGFAFALSGYAPVYFGLLALFEALHIYWMWGVVPAEQRWQTIRAQLRVFLAYVVPTLFPLLFNGHGIRLSVLVAVGFLLASAHHASHDRRLLGAV